MPVHRGDLANALKLARSRARLTQAQLAERANITDETISRIERGAFEPSLSTLHDIADALGASVDELIGRLNRPLVARDGAAPGAETLRVAAAIDRLPTPTRSALVALIESLGALLPSPAARPVRRPKR
jgi:transcriptional regulator with XRE-family HTH domain